MAKATSCKEAIANFEKAKGVVAAETDKVRLNLSCVEIPEQLRLFLVTDAFLAGLAIWSSASHRQDGR